MDWVPLVSTALGSGALSAAFSGFFATRRSNRKEDLTSEAKVREDLRTVFREERDSHAKCEEEVKGLRTDLMNARISEAVLGSQVVALEKQMAEIRQAFLRKYLQDPGSTPPVVPG